MSHYVSISVPQRGTCVYSRMLRQASQKGVKTITHWVIITNFTDLLSVPDVSDLTCHKQRLVMPFEFYDKFIFSAFNLNISSL